MRADEPGDTRSASRPEALESSVGTHTGCSDARRLGAPQSSTSRNATSPVRHGDAHRVARRAAALGRAPRVEDLKAALGLVQRQVRVAEDDRVGVGERRAAAAPGARAPARRRGSRRSARSPASISVRSGSRRAQARRRRRCRARRPARGRGRRSPRSAAAAGEVAGVDHQVGGAHPLARRPSGSRRRPRGRWVSAITAIVDHAQSSARNATTSSPSSSGSSKAAKCPPRSNSVQRRRSARTRSRPLARRADDLGREVGDRRRDLDPLPGRQAPAVARLGGVEAHRGGDRPGRPVDGEEVAELVLGEAALDLAVAVRPAPVLVDQPGGEPGGRVVEARRERVGRRALDEQVKALAQRASAAPAWAKASSASLIGGSREVGRHAAARPAAFRCRAATAAGSSNAIRAPMIAPQSPPWTA